MKAASWCNSVAVGAVAMTLGLSTTALAGKEAGNGGVVHVCRDQNTRKLMTVELLDLYRARVERGYTFESTATAPKVRASLALMPLAKMNLRLFDIVWALNDRLDQLHYFVDTDVSLMDTGDAVTEWDHLKPEPGCKFEQLAVFTKGGTLLIQEPLYRKLDQVNLTAFRLHESIYRMALVHMAIRNKYSIRTQRLVGSLLASESPGEDRIEKDLREIHPDPLSQVRDRYSSLGCGSVQYQPLLDTDEPVEVQVEVGSGEHFRRAAGRRLSIELRLPRSKRPVEIIHGDAHYVVHKKRFILPIRASGLGGAKILAKAGFGHKNKLTAHGFEYEVRIYQGDRLIARANNTLCDLVYPGDRYFPQSRIILK